MRLLRAFAPLALVAFASLAHCQVIQLADRTVTLGPAECVATNVMAVSWSPEESAAMYTCGTPTGTDIGIYDMKRNEGRSVVSLGKGERIGHAGWLKFGKTALVETIKDVGDQAKPSHVVTLYAISSGDLTARKLWSQQSPAGKDIAVDFDASPNRCHAIVEVRIDKVRSYYVVTDGATNMVYSSDLTDASNHGYGGAGWSVDGTMLFASGQPAGLNDSAGYVLNGDGGSGILSKISFSTSVATLAGADGDGNQTFTFVTDGNDNGSGDANAQIVQGVTATLSNLVLTDDNGATFAFGRSRPTLSPTSMVMECMSSNGVLREINFPGYWSGPAEQKPLMQAKTEQVVAKLGQSTENVQSLWLVPEGSAENPTSGLLVAADVDRHWLVRSGTAVAYTVHKALFVRTVRAAH